MNDSYILNHTQCPECAKQGRDNGHDNMGVYSDGHSWCWSCGFYMAGSKIQGYVSRSRDDGNIVEQSGPILRLPADCDQTLPMQARRGMQGRP